MKYIDIDNVYAIRDLNLTFNNDIEDIIQSTLKKDLIKIKINKKTIDKIRGLKVIENSILVIYLDNSKILFYLFVYDKILEKNITMGVDVVYGKFLKNKTNPFLIFVNFNKFSELLDWYNDNSLNIYFYDNKSPIIVEGTEKIGIIAPIVESGELNGQ